MIVAYLVSRFIYYKENASLDYARQLYKFFMSYEGYAKYKDEVDMLLETEGHEDIIN